MRLVIAIATGDCRVDEGSALAWLGLAFLRTGGDREGSSLRRTLDSSPPFTN